MRILLFLTFIPALLYAQKGVVIGIVGNWTDGASAKKLGLGDSLELGRTVRSTGPGSSLDVSFPDPKQPFRILLRCAQHGGCSETLVRDKARQESTWLARLTAAIAPLFQKDHEQFIAAVSREFGPRPREAVSFIQGDTLDLKEAFEGMPPRTYRLRVNDAATPVAFTWRPGTPTGLPIARLKPGIYKLTFVDDSDDPTGTDVWILAAPAARASALHDDFAQIRSLTAKWTDEDPASIRTILRAYLYSLSTRL